MKPVLVLRAAIPGDEHAWVDWLWREEMRDQSRMDEELESKEGDEENALLQGFAALMGLVR